MGVLQDFKNWFLSQRYWSVSTYDAWVLRYAEEFLKTHHPGISVGPTYEFDAMAYPGMFAPTLAAADNEGEMYLSNDRTPPQLFIWRNNAWWRVDLKSISTL